MLSTKTNLEITEYHEKFFLGLSLRQLACFGVAAVLAHSKLLRLSAMASAGYSAGFLHRNGRSSPLSWAGLYQP